MIVTGVASPRCMAMRWFALPIFGLGIALHCTEHSAHAATLNPDDGIQPAQLLREFLQLMGDVISAARAAGSKSQECLINMSSDLQNISDHVMEISDLVDISTSMQSQQDESVVNTVLVRMLVLTRKDLVVSRNSINLSAGYCGYDSLVNEKARQSLRLISNLDAVIGGLQRKLGGVR